MMSLNESKNKVFIYRIILVAILVFAGYAVISYVTTPKPLKNVESAKVSNKVNIDNAKFVNLVNEVRAKENLKPLTNNGLLELSAELKADDMAEKDYFAHDSPTGTKPWAYFDKVEYDYTEAGENLARCFDTPEAFVAAWVASPGHKKNIVGNYKDVGFGAARADNGCLIVVNHFGKL